MHTLMSFPPLISDVSSYSNAHFGQGSGPILLKNVGCTGSESNLTSCTHDPIGEVGDCTHEDDAGVMCYNRKYSFYLVFVNIVYIIQPMSKPTWYMFP